LAEPHGLASGAPRTPAPFLRPSQTKAQVYTAAAVSLNLGMYSASRGCFSQRIYLQVLGKTKKKLARRVHDSPSKKSVWRRARLLYVVRVWVASCRSKLTRSTELLANDGSWIRQQPRATQSGPQRYTPRLLYKSLLKRGRPCLPRREQRKNNWLREKLLSSAVRDLHMHVAVFLGPCQAVQHRG
jgi:hypothetical protein